MSAKRPRVQATTPCLIVSDLDRSIAYYRDMLGFREPAVWGEPPCFGMLHRDGFDLMLSLVEVQAQAPGGIHPNGVFGVWDFYIKVEDAEAEAEYLRAAGVKLAREPQETEYGMIEIDVVDPDGYRICFGSDLD